MALPLSESHRRVALRRVVVVGAWGAGKSRLAAALSAALGIPRIEHDPLYWAEDWGPRPVEAFRALVAAATAGEAWRSVRQLRDSGRRVQWLSGIARNVCRRN